MTRSTCSLSMILSMSMCGGIAHKAEDRAADALGNADFQIFRFKLRSQFSDISLFRARLHNNDHVKTLPYTSLL